MQVGVQAVEMAHEAQAVDRAESGPSSSQAPFGRGIADQGTVSGECPVGRQRGT